jgi:PqqD family protein of HPr-rel-A system
VWDDGLVLYDSRSDEIHRFDSLTGEVFDELRSRPRRLADLVAAMSERLEVVADQELEELVAEILRILSSKNIAAPLG